MHPLAKPTLHRSHAGYSGHTHPRKGPDEESAEDDDGLELPVNPDQGTPLIPDEDGNATVPS